MSIAVSAAGMLSLGPLAPLLLHDGGPVHFPLVAVGDLPVPRHISVERKLLVAICAISRPVESIAVGQHVFLHLEGSVGFPANITNCRLHH